MNFNLGLPAGSRVVVAMSGGVDSSAVAAILCSLGYEVIGVTMLLYDQGVSLGNKKTCCAGVDIYDAKNVAQKLGIPHYVLDFQEVFKRDVIDYFRESYEVGETPVPCIKCNDTVKFRDLVNFAKDLGAKALVTGHYLRKKFLLGGESALFRGKDPKRDQSYFLFNIGKDLLDFLLFPLGDIDSKDITRQIAAEHGLITAKKPDSQDICFVGGGRYTDFLQKIGSQPEAGEIIDVDGKVLGKHRGLIFYTIGQRRGLNIAASEPLYVIDLKKETNQVVVGIKEQLPKNKFLLREVNLLANIPRNVTVKIRSVGDPVPANINYSTAGDPVVELIDFQLGISPGQACVFYDIDRLLGGGWIAEVL